jgi:hypothetical protein
MLNELPNERQTVEVNLDDNSWQPATFRNGQFVDIYGLPLDQGKISGWRLLDAGLPELPPRHRGWFRP